MACFPKRRIKLSAMASEVGIYNAVLEVSDGVNIADRSFDITVSAPQTDSDGDGVSDAQELAAEEDPTTSPVLLSPTVYLFGTTGGTKTFSVTNPSSHALTLSNATLEAADAGSFGIDFDGCTGIASGECGTNYNEAFFSTPVLTPYESSVREWNSEGISAKKFF